MQKGEMQMETKIKDHMFEMRIKKDIVENNYFALDESVYKKRWSTVRNRILTEDQQNFMNLMKEQGVTRLIIDKGGSKGMNSIRMNLIIEHIKNGGKLVFSSVESRDYFQSIFDALKPEGTKVNQ